MCGFGLKGNVKVQDVRLGRLNINDTFIIYELNDNICTSICLMEDSLVIL